MPINANAVSTLKGRADGVSPTQIESGLYSFSGQVETP